MSLEVRSHSGTTPSDRTVKLSQTMLKMLDEYTQHFDARKCVLEQALLARAGLGEVITGRAEDLLPGRIWKSSALYNDYLQRIDFQALLGSRYLAKNGMAHSILLHRGSDLTDFTERERRLLDYCFLHISSLLGIRLADFGEPSLIDRLRPRERDVLCLFLRQMSERQVATALGISPHTVRDHAKRLNRFFQVKSRDQLVATTIKFLPLLELDLEQRRTLGS
ncbi:MAG: helix-turn-helix transcriptional regulator [Planctomycetales bacterium]|nr:helix-turn-helix transcriptional regulator [Planctomycetales bacterium]